MKILAHPERPPYYCVMVPESLDTQSPEKIAGTLTGLLQKLHALELRIARAERPRAWNTTYLQHAFRDFANYNADDDADGSEVLRVIENKYRAERRQGRKKQRDDAFKKVIGLRDVLRDQVAKAASVFMPVAEKSGIDTTDLALFTKTWSPEISHRAEVIVDRYRLRVTVPTANAKLNASEKAFLIAAYLYSGTDDAATFNMIDVRNALGMTEAEENNLCIPLASGDNPYIWVTEYPNARLRAFGQEVAGPLAASQHPAMSFKQALFLLNAFEVAPLGQVVDFSTLWWRMLKRIGATYFYYEPVKALTTLLSRSPYEYLVCTNEKEGYLTQAGRERALAISRQNTASDQLAEREEGSSASTTDAAANSQPLASESSSTTPSKKRRLWVRYVIAIVCVALLFFVPSLFSENPWLFWNQSLPAQLFGGIISGLLVVVVLFVLGHRSDNGQ